MGQVKYIWTEENVGKRIMPEIPEEGDRTKSYSEKHWSQVESLPKSHIQEIQWIKLENLLKFAYERSPFYKEKWDRIGIKPSDIRSLEDLPKLPIVTKYDFQKDQEEYPPYGTACTSPPNAQMKYWQTSGITAKPRLWAETKEDWEHGIELYIRCLWAHGIRPGWRGFYGFSFPPFIGFWLCYYSSEVLGCQNVPKGPIPTEAWLGLIKNLAGTAPSFLCSTPTFAIRQLEAAKKLGIDCAELGIKILTLAGEPGAGIPSTRKFLEEGFGVKVHDILGSTENSGPILFSCDWQAEQEILSDHISADYFIVELLDPQTLEPVEKGKPGVNCVTSLARYGMPAIRFLLGDFLEIDEDHKCGCGRTLPVAMGGVKTRKDDMIIVKGVNIYPSLIEESVRSIPGLSKEYRLRKTKLGLTVIVEPEPGVPESQYAELIQRLQDDIRAKTTVRLDIELEKPGTLPREEAKTKRIIEESS